MRVFKAEIERDFSVASFTSLTEGAQADAPERFAPPWSEDAERGPAVDDIHAFPAGARSGICLHEIFERLDFADLQHAERLVSLKLADNGFDSPRWTPAVLACVRRVLQTTLPGGVRLDQIMRTERLVEREFHLPVGRLEAAALQRLVGGGESHPLSFQPRRGWLKGFIDLIFRYGERYYLLDWKSNRLGPQAEAYSAETVLAAMESHHYPLQAHLYAIALHRYLASRLADYDYERHFGGMTYLFVRGHGSRRAGAGRVARPSQSRPSRRAQSVAGASLIWLARANPARAPRPMPRRPSSPPHSTTNSRA